MFIELEKGDDQDFWGEIEVLLRSNYDKIKNFNLATKNKYYNNLWHKDTTR